MASPLRIERTGTIVEGGVIGTPNFMCPVYSERRSISDLSDLLFARQPALAGESRNSGLAEIQGFG
jgi:hypothetical protein